LDITTIHRSGFLSAQIRITLNDLECPIQLKVRLVHGTLDVRLLRVSDSTIRRGRGGKVGWRTKPPPCEQLTRCFSAVAELLVIKLLCMYVHRESKKGDTTLVHIGLFAKY